MSVHEHRREGPGAIRVAVVTVSDTRTAPTDGSGAAIRTLCEAAGHGVASYEILPDDPDRVAGAVRLLAARGDVDAVILNGGTGLSRRDTTHEAVSGLLDKKIDGFGELFRMLSYQQVGPAAMLSRAVAGSVGDRAVFCLPGAEPAVRLAMEKLILPEIGHLIGELRKGREHAP